LKSKEADKGEDANRNQLIPCFLIEIFK